MRIGVIASPWIPVPPPAYGGTETIIHSLCIGLDRRGHETHLVTVGDSTCPVRRSSVFDRPPTAIGEPGAEIVHARAAYALLQDVDVIHDHTTVGPQFLPETAVDGIPVVTTAHCPFSSTARMMFGNRPAGVALVAISNAQRATAPEIDIEAVIHHGIDVDLHPPGPGGGGYLMFIGRMSPDKGPDRAIEVARRARMPLVIAAKMRESCEVAYYEEHVRPLLGSDVTFVGEADAATRRDLLRHAEALVNPIRWPEPFGLVMAESLAAATPVIALSHGAAPEIVDDGSTGFLCDGLDQMAAAVHRIGEIDRQVCREAAVRRFSVERMAADHEVLYERLVARVRGSRTAVSSTLNGNAPDRSGAWAGAATTASTGAALPDIASTSTGTGTGTGTSTGTSTAARSSAPNVTPFDSARARHRLGIKRRPPGGPGSNC